MADPSIVTWAKNRAKRVEQKYGTSEPQQPLPVPDVAIGDKVKVTTDGEIGTITSIVPRASAYLAMADGTERMVPLGYLEKVA